MKFLLDDLDRKSEIPSIALPQRRENITGYFAFLIAAIANISLWLIAFSYIGSAPKNYTSNFVVSLPGSGSTTEVGVPGLGNASHVNWSPYSGAQYDPREDYKVIAQSKAVIQQAANSLNLEPYEFGSPTVSPRDNTTLIEFSVTGPSPQEAQNKAIAFYTAFEDKLDALRFEDVAQSKRNFQISLQGLVQDVDTAQARLSTFQVESGLNTEEQISKLAENIEVLRYRLAETLSDEKQTGAQRQKIASQLKLPEQQADIIFALQSDLLYQDTYRKYKEVTAQLIQLSAKYTHKYIGIIEAKSEQDLARQTLLNRAREILGINLTWNELEKITLLSSSESAQNVFLRELTQISAQQEGLRSRSNELNAQISSLEDRLTNLVAKKSTLNALKRDLEVAETVFSSTLARASLEHSNIYSSYPEIRLVQPPSHPESSSSPNTKLVLLGTTMSSIFITVSCILLFIYQRRQDHALITSSHTPPALQGVGHS